ncbi:peptide MFS transporter [Lichenicoccus sp.]|uniref:peptide MFS transporter n=1 Tax=Lichenicoccus sp. TaxID=2781899 RepID=UPI003D0FA618
MMSAELAAPPQAPAADTAFFGHPRGLAVIAFTEGWIGFSLYGTQACLILYMTSDLLRPGHSAHIIGFSTLLALLRPVYGNLQGEPLASAIMGLYIALIWATPIAGGILSDRCIGRTRTILLGCLLMTVGHFLLAFEASFLLALLFLIGGVGCGACVQAQLGSLYATSDPRRTDAFQIYSMAVCLAVILAPLICGTLGEAYAWHWGFAAAGCGMLIGLIVYLAGRHTLPPEAPVRRLPQSGRSSELKPGDRQVLLLLLLLLPIVALVLLGNTQLFNAYLIWARENYQLVFFGHRMPTSWLLSIDAAISVVTILVSVVFWRWWERHHAAPHELAKMAMGAGIMATAPLILALAAWQDGGRHAIGLEWGLAFHLVNSFGFANIYPIGLALFSRVAPSALGATIVNAYGLNLFLSNLLAGSLGGLLPDLSGAHFWLLHAALIAVGALMLFTVFRSFSALLVRPGQAAEWRASEPACTKPATSPASPDSPGSDHSSSLGPA